MSIQLGASVQIKDKKHLFYGERGTVQAVRLSCLPWTPTEVLVKLRCGETCYASPDALGVAA